MINFGGFNLLELELHAQSMDCHGVELCEHDVNVFLFFFSQCSTQHDYLSELSRQHIHADMAEARWIYHARIA